jgi:N-carbamoyl-L-amino-acid hydrolase
MNRLQLQVTSDAAGNTIGRYAGTQPLGAIVVGSHTDTVAQGGRFDGALGVLAGLACLRALRDAGVHLRHPIEVINFAAEEATVLGTLGSSALVGQLQASDLAKPAYDGRSIASHLVAAGFDPVQILAARRTEPVAAYLELHIEQGDVLEAENTPIGLVEGIVGIRRYRAIYTGQANHAGTTQMARRRDALVAAAQFILAVREVAIAHGIVGTVGTLNVHPNVPNVIPGRVELSCEIRGLDTHILERADADLQQHARATGGVLEVIASGTPVASDPMILDVFAACCEQRQIRYRRMPSGAGRWHRRPCCLCPARRGSATPPLSTPQRRIAFRAHNCCWMRLSRWMFNCNNLAITQAIEIISEGSGHWVVGGHEQGDTSVIAQAAKNIQHLFAGSAVEITGWLIGQNDLRARHECSGDGDPLLLATRKFVWPMVCPFRQPHCSKAA